MWDAGQEGRRVVALFDHCNSTSSPSFLGSLIASSAAELQRIRGY
jgi:hypothetical protein